MLAPRFAFELEIGDGATVLIDYPANGFFGRIKQIIVIMIVCVCVCVCVCSLLVALIELAHCSTGPLTESLGDFITFLVFTLLEVHRAKW